MEATVDDIGKICIAWDDDVEYSCIGFLASVILAKNVTGYKMDPLVNSDFYNFRNQVSFKHARVLTLEEFKKRQGIKDEVS